MHIMGTIMGSGNFEVDVAPACSGAVPTSIYLAAVLAYPTTWRAKLARLARIGIGVHPYGQSVARLRRCF